MSKARCILDIKVRRSDLLAQLVIWQLPEPTPDRPHGLKYRLWCGRAGETIVRYDNETGKGDHRHCGDREEPYAFADVQKLIQDFAEDVRRMTGWSIP